LASVSLLSLAACGGGGGGVASTPAPATSAAAAPPPVVTTPAPTTPVATTPILGTTPNSLNWVTPEYGRSNAASQAGAATAYQNGATGRGVTIATLDSGVDIQSAEFAGRISAASQDVVGGRGIDDEAGHGTSTAALIVAAKNEINIHGVAFDATLLALRTETAGSCTEDKGCSHSDNVLARGIDIAVANGARIINLSLGGSPANLTLRSAMARATRAGVAIVISAGNDGSASPDSLAQVAGDASVANGLIVIAGSIGTATDARAISTFSNKAGTFGSVYIAAPGYRVRSFDHTGANFLYSGTSYAAPIVSGAIALLMQAFPNLTAAQAVELVLRNADDAGAAGTDADFGRGILNIANAFRPQGSLLLAGSAIPVADESGSLGGAFGTGGQLGTSLGGAIILDGYSRAYAIDLAAGIAAAPVERPLGGRLGDRTRVARAGNGDRVVSFTLTPPTSTRPWLGIVQDGVDFHAADRTRLRRGLAAMRLDPTTSGGLAFGYTAETLLGSLGGDAPVGSFLIDDALGETGLARRGAVATGVQRRIGSWTLSAAGGRAEVAPVLPGDRPGAASTAAATARRTFGPLSLTAGLSDMREDRTLLGARLPQSFGVGGATTRFATLDARLDFGRWSLAAGARRGWTDADGGGALADLGTVRSDAWRTEASGNGLFRSGDRLALRVSQPLRVSSARASFLLPVSYDYATLGVGTERRDLSLAPDAREIDVEANYGVPLWGGALDANAYWRRDPGHIAARADDLGIALRFARGF
jgi:subtilisin family serine protease